MVATDPSLAMPRVVRDVTPTVGHGLGRRLRCRASAESSAAAVPGSVGRYPSGMSNAISGLLGAIVGGLAAIAGAWLQARNTARLQREAAEQQEKRRRAESRQLLARRYLYQLGDAVDSLLHRVDNWAHRGGPRYAEGLHPGYWEITSLYVVARALAAERILALQGVYVELQALSSSEDANLPPRAVEEAMRRAFGQGLFYYHRLALAEAALAAAATSSGSSSIRSSFDVTKIQNGILNHFLIRCVRLSTHLTKKGWKNSGSLLQA